MVDKTTAAGAQKIIVNKTELKKRLTPLQYKVTQEAATESSGSGEYNKHFMPGKYNCIVCNQELFDSESKYDSGSGWPAFSQCLEGKVEERPDGNQNKMSIEVVCRNCGAHLGHVFDRGPKPTGRRYCINSAAINFESKK